MQKILVTGAAGFIGSHLCERLLAGGRRVVGLDCFDEFYDPSIKRRNVAGCKGNSGFELIEGDIRDAAAVEKALAGCDLVVHLAARAGVRPSIENPLLYQDVNVRGTNVILEAMRKLSLKKMVFASSSSVYGNNEKVPFSETDVVDNPISPYAATKKAGELLCHTYHHLFGMDITCLRFFTLYGARQPPPASNQTPPASEQRFAHDQLRFVPAPRRHVPQENLPHLLLLSGFLQVTRRYSTCGEQLPKPARCSRKNRG